MREVRVESAKRDRRRGEGNACHDAIVFFVFYIQILDAKIVIGQNLESVKIDCSDRSVCHSID